MEALIFFDSNFYQFSIFLILFLIYFQFMILFSSKFFIGKLFLFYKEKIMNREYSLIGIALGRTSAETNNITLTD